MFGFHTFFIHTFCNYVHGEMRSGSPHYALLAQDEVL